MSKKILVILLTLVVSLLVVGCSSGPSLSLSETEIKLGIGESYTISPITDVEGSDVVDYVVADPTILAIEGNVITALKEGTTTVKLSLKDKPAVTASLKVVIEVAPGIEITGSSVVYIGESTQLTAVLTGITGEVEWFSDNDTVAIVDQNGKVSGNKLGSATITAVCGEYEAMIDIYVQRKPVIVISGEKQLQIGNTITLTESHKNIDGTVVWSSSDESVATVDQTGKVTGVAEGEVEITVTINDFSESYAIEVFNSKIVVTGPESVFVDETVELKAEVVGATYTGTYKWISNDAQVATVDQNGKVTGVAEGLVTIVVSTDELETSFEIQVSKRKEIIISGGYDVDLGDVLELEAELVNLEGTVTWSSSNTSVATVDANGVVTGVKLGNVTITATLDGVTATVDLEVIEVSDKVTYYFEGGSSEELYLENTQKSEMTGTSSSGFWSSYSSNIFVFKASASNNDKNPTFSDRISVGKNKYTGLYEILDICTSGTATWPAGMEYVIVISNSYSNFRAEHTKVQLLEVGDLVFFEKDPATISASNHSKITFCGKNLKANKLTVQKNDYTGELITPVKLGNEFLGWYDSTGKKYESLSKDQISGNVKLTAKWNELNPVTSLNVNNIPSEMETDDTFQIVASVNPTNAFFTQVLYSTSDKDVIQVTDNGLLTAINTGVATITVRDYVGKVIKTYEITVNAIPSIDIKFPNDYNGVLEVGNTLQLEPSYLGKTVDNLSFTYTSSDSKIATVDASGLVKAVANGSVTITIKSSNGKELPIGVTVYGMTESDRVDEVINLLIDNAHAEVEVGNACLYNDGTIRYYDSMYGSVNYFLFDEYAPDFTYQSQAVATGSHSGTRSQSDILFVTVHDTATLSGTGKSMAEGMSTSGNVSIHYVVGNEKVYAILPENYVAWHAGDGTGIKFQWLATGVAGEDGVQPEFDMVKDGSTYYFTINGQKTKVVCPVADYNGRKIANPSKAHFSELGPTWTVINGEYHIGTPWVNFGQNVSGVICSKGGNNNSVGIEMCMNTAGNIYDSYHRNSQLVADILVRNGLDLTRVKQHNTFDGKNCPQVIRAGNYWDEFMKMVAVNYYIFKDYKDAKISMVSDNPSIVDNTGRVINPPQVATTVSYTITVTIGSTTKSIKLSSVVPGTTSWEKWDGRYPASLIWNNGNFVVNK